MNPFRNKTPQEVMKSEQEKREIADRLKKVSESAKHILSSQDAEKYRKELFESRDNLIRMLMDSNESDPIRFSFLAKCALNKLSVLYDLLSSIEGDAK